MKQMAEAISLTRMFIIHRVQNDFSSFFQSFMRPNTWDCATLYIDITSCQIFYALQCLPFWSNQSLSSFRKFFFISHNILISRGNWFWRSELLKSLTFNFDDFNSVFIVKTFDSLLIWHRPKLVPILWVTNTFYDKPCHEFD